MIFANVFQIYDFFVYIIRREYKWSNKFLYYSLSDVYLQNREIFFGKKTKIFKIEIFSENEKHL